MTLQRRNPRNLGANDPKWGVRWYHESMQVIESSGREFSRGIRGAFKALHFSQAELGEILEESSRFFR